MSQITVTVPGVVLDNSLFSDGFQLSDIEGWWDSADPRIDSEPREFGHGDFGQDDVFQGARFVTVTGTFQSYSDPDAIFSARDTLTALHEVGVFPFTVTDPRAQGTVFARLASRVSWDEDYAPGCARFEFTVKADDPRVYGPAQVGSTGVPTAGIGVADPIIDPFSEGAPGNLGRVTVVNTGTAPSEPRVRVTGGLSGGFELRHIEVGRVIRVTREIFDGSFVDIDMGSGAVWIDDQSPVPASDVPVSEWVSVAPGATATLQFTPLGVVTGTPTMTVEWAVASW